MTTFLVGWGEAEAHDSISLEETKQKALVFNNTFSLPQDFPTRLQK